MVPTKLRMWSTVSNMLNALAWSSVLVPVCSWQNRSP